MTRGAGLASVGEIEGVRPRNLQLDSPDMSDVMDILSLETRRCAAGLN